MATSSPLASASPSPAFNRTPGHVACFAQTTAAGRPLTYSLGGTPTMVREYRPNDLAAVVNVFNRAVREIAVRDYAAEQVAAWAPSSPDLKQWAHRLSNEAVFVYESENCVVGFLAVESNGH